MTKMMIFRKRQRILVWKFKIYKIWSQTPHKNLCHAARFFLVWNSWRNGSNSSEIFFEKSRRHDLVMVFTLKNLSHKKNVTRLLFVWNSLLKLWFFKNINKFLPENHKLAKFSRKLHTKTSVMWTDFCLCVIHD